jgi:hypothetical protein
MPLAPPPPHTLPPPGPRLARIAYAPPFDSAASAGVQPAGELRHLQGHEHGHHVRGAPRACPGPQHSLESGLPLCMPLAPPPPHALPPPVAQSRPASHVPLPSTRQFASAFNQPLSFDTSKVTNMASMFRVRSARALAPSSLDSGLPRACRLRRRRPTPFRLPARTTTRIACPSLQLGSTRWPSTSR